jgi:RNA polymerase sigma factor (sigma-70 family)
MADIIKQMQVLDDMQLLREYASGHSEEAFSTLVSRYINLVYSAAFRSVSNPHQAEEITQSVFVILARKAGALRRGTVLSGWLYQTARLTAANFLRTELRRQHREQEAHMQSTLNDAEPDAWPQIRPLQDDAMAELNEKDRNAIVLRFFEGKPLKEVGQALGASEDAAKMRVNRALEKLREIFVKRGITLPGAALAAAISSNSIQAAPAGLAAAVAAGIGQSSALTASTLVLLKGTMQTITWIKATAAVGAAAIIALQWHQNAAEKLQIKQLEEQSARQAEAFRAQKVELDQVKQQNATFAKSMEGMARDVAKARATVTHAPPPAVTAASGGGLPNFKGNMLAEMMKNPEMIKALREQQSMMVKLQYGPLARQLNLSPEQTDSLYQILVDKSLRVMESGSSTLSGGNPGDAAQTAADQGKETESALQALLGDAGYKAYQDYQTTVADRTLLNSIKSNFVDNPLSDEQQQQLLQVMTSARQSIAGPNAPDLSQLSPEDKLAKAGQFLQQQEQINQQVLAQATGFLSPDQLQTLGASQSNIVSLQKAGMAVAQKMFGSSAPTPQNE